MAKKTTAKPRVSVKLRDLLKRFEDATIAREMRYVNIPDEDPAAEKNYAAARKALIAFLVEMQESRRQLADVVHELELACQVHGVPLDARMVANDALDRFDKSP